MVSKASTAELYHQIYDMLIQRIPQSKICKYLRRDKGQVSRMVNRLIDGGYLQCFNPQSRDRIYIATKKPFNAKELYKLPSSKSQRIHGRCNIIQIQKHSFITEIKSPPKANIKWDKEWDINGLHLQQYSFPFPTIGEVKFRRETSKSSDRLKIILPRLVWERHDGDPEPFLRQIADRAGTWFMHEFKMELMGIEVCQNPHYALMLSDSKLIDMTRKGTYSNDNIMIDASKPDELPEIESTKWDLIDGLSQAPDEIRKLKVEMKEIRGIVISIKSDLMEIKSFFAKPEPSKTTLEGYA